MPTATEILELISEYSCYQHSYSMYGMENTHKKITRKLNQLQHELNWQRKQNEIKTETIKKLKELAKEQNRTQQDIIDAWVYHY